MNLRSQYIETLIKLIETNQDKSWLQAFLSLRSGGYLPSGGAGSLNDWGPTYKDKIINVWYSQLYNITRYLFDNNLIPAQIDTFKPIKFRNSIRIIRCLNCGKNYQHPDVFESHIALDFYKNSFLPFANRNELIEILNPVKSFASNEIIEYRKWLSVQYDMQNIKIYDFVTAKYICPHCNKDHSETEHDLYKIISIQSGEKIFKLIKQNANWKDFEE